MAPKSGFEMCFAIGPIGAGGKTRLESSTKKKRRINPHLVYACFSGQVNTRHLHPGGGGPFLVGLKSALCTVQQSMAERNMLVPCFAGRHGVLPQFGCTSRHASFLYVCAVPGLASCVLLFYGIILCAHTHDPTVQCRFCSHQ